MSENSKEKKVTSFPENQVMMMLESMNDGIAVIAENQIGIRDELKEFKEEMYGFKEETLIFQKKTNENFQKVFVRLDTIESELSGDCF